MRAFKQTVTLTNPRQEPACVWFEPWGQDHALQGSSSLRLEVEAEIEGPVDICHRGDGSIIAYFPPTSTVKIFEGDDLVCDLHIAFPLSGPYLKGLSTRDVVNALFGEPEQAGAPDDQHARADDTPRDDAPTHDDKGDDK